MAWIFQNGSRWALVAALLAASVTLDASVASAQCGVSPPAPGCVSQVGATAKGAIAGGILGAEIGFIVPAILVYAGVRELDQWWSWILFPTIGAVGGAIGGYFALEDPMNGMTRGFPEVAVTMLAISMALIVPTFVGVLALTSYNPGADSSPGGGDEDQAGDDESDSDQDDHQTATPPATTGTPSEESTPATTTPAETAPPPPATPPTPPATDSTTQGALRRMMAGGPGILRFASGSVLLGVPMVQTVDTYTPEERAHMQLPLTSDVRIPVVSGTF